MKDKPSSGAHAPFSRTFTLKDGSLLSYAEFGDPASERVVLYGHGFPGTGEEAGIAHRAALSHGFRIIAPTRPGIGMSTFDPHRTIASWPDTILELVESLGIEKLFLLGVSGGTPYTLAFLQRFPERVLNCLIVSGMGPPHSVVFDGSMSLFSRIPIWCAYRAPGLSRLIISLIAAISRRSPEALLACYKACMSADDRRLLGVQLNARRMIQNFQLALRQGATGVYHDFRLLMSPWGFELSAISFPVTFIHGTKDKLVPLSIAKANVRQIPQAALREYQGKGHFMAFEMTEEIMKLLTERSS